MSRYFSGLPLLTIFSVTDRTQRLETHFDEFDRACRRIFDWLFSIRVKVVLPDVIESAIEVARMWPSRKRGDQLLAASSYRAACRKG